MSKNIMIFGLPDDDNEVICDKVYKVFEQLSDESNVEANHVL